MNQYYVYIVTNIHRTLYTGVTNDLERRVLEHKSRAIDGFAKKYGVDRLVYYETSDSVGDAIQRERQIKGWLRRKKIALIDAFNPEWKDLSEEW